MCTFDSGVHYYNLKASLSQPQMLVVPDLTDAFLPVPEDLLVNLSESRAVVEALLDSLAQASVRSVHFYFLCWWKQFLYSRGRVKILSDVPPSIGLWSNDKDVTGFVRLNSWLPNKVMNEERRGQGALFLFSSCA